MLGLREGDRRIAWAGFTTLSIAMAAHAILETARDTLFLTELPVERLPWAYLAMAAVTFAVAAASHRVDRGRDQRRVLIGTLGASSAGTAILAWPAMTATPSALGALYVWTGMVATLVVIAFWLCLGDRVDVTRAKRIYGVVAAGALAGALAGSLIAASVLTTFAPRTLIAVAAALYAVAALAATRTPPGATHRPPTGEVAGPSLAAVLQEPYTRRIALAAMLAPVVATGIDFVFKSAVTAHVAAEGLGTFFAHYNAAVYSVALVFQLGLASRLLGWLGVTRSVAVLPLLLVGGAGAVAASAALGAAMVLRGTDVVVRHSLHRAATEILFLPVERSSRVALKAFADSIAQRGGQALTSIALLAAVHAGASTSHVAAGVAAVALAWAVTYLGLRGHYVARFRAQIRELSPETAAEVPQLDLQSLETLIGTLSAPNDAEVIAALDVLEAYGRAHLVPPLILYHPSAAVVTRALRLFDDVHRDDVDAIRRRLLDHDDPTVRAAAIRALAASGCPSALLRATANDDPAPSVQTAALAAWLGRQSGIDEDETERTVREILGSWHSDARLALAHVVHDFRGGLAARLAMQLVRGGPASVRRAVADALADTDDVAYLEVCIELLAFHDTRPHARTALVAMGAPALTRLSDLLTAPDTPSPIRLHVPRSISAFPGEDPPMLLSRALDDVGEPRVRYKILRGLGRVRTAAPDRPVDDGRVLDAARRSFDRAVRLLGMQVAWETYRSLGWSTHDTLLGPLLRESEERAIEETFRALHVLAPTEPLRSIYNGLLAPDDAVAAGSRELLEHVVADATLRGGILAITDALPPAARLTAVRRVWTLNDDPIDVPTIADVDAVSPTEREALAEHARALLTTLLASHDAVVAEVARWSLRIDATDGPVS